MSELFTNNASTTLAGTGLAASSPGVTQTFDVLSVAGFPTGGTFRAVCAGEILRVVAVNAAASPPRLTAVRGDEGTAATAKPAGTTLTEVLTAAALAALSDDIVARVAATAPLQVTFPGGNPTLALPPATGSVDGYMTATQAAKLAAVAAGAQVNVLEGVTASLPLTAGPVTGKQQALAINPASAGAAGSLSAAHYNDLVNATDQAVAGRLAKRDGAGDLRVRYLFSTFLNSSADEYRGDQPARLVGGLGDGYLRTWNPAAVTVGGANYATNAGTATQANALVPGTADANKLAGINTSYGTDAQWRYYYLPNGKRVFALSYRATLPASVTMVLGQINCPAGLTFANLTLLYTVAMGDGQAVNIGFRYGLNGPGHGDMFSGPTTGQLTAESVDRTTFLNSYSAQASCHLMALEI